MGSTTTSCSPYSELQLVDSTVHWIWDVAGWFLLTVEKVYEDVYSTTFMTIPLIPGPIPSENAPTPEVMPATTDPESEREQEVCNPTGPKKLLGFGSGSD